MIYTTNKLLNEIVLLQKEHNWDGNIMLPTAAEFVSLRLSICVSSKGSY